jgi:hypothetical protein
MGKNPYPTGIAGTGTFPVYPSPLPVGEPDYLSCHASIRPKEAQYRYFGPNLNSHIYSLCVLGTLVQFFPTISASSTSTPVSRALVPLASSVRSLCHLCSSSSQPRSFSSASPRLRHLYPVKKKRLRLQSCDPKCPCLSGMQYPSGIYYPTDNRRVWGWARICTRDS